jgi:hypothetical protein
VTVGVIEKPDKGIAITLGSGIGKELVFDCDN